MHSRFHFLLLLSLCTIAVKHADSAPITPRYSGYPQSARLVRVTEKLNLQVVLDAEKIVRLENADYQTGGLGSITIRSGYQIYGLPDTKLPQIFVEGGTSDAIVSGVWTPSIYFPASPKTTRDNIFQRINGRVFVRGAILEDNLFLSLNYSQIDIDTRPLGYLRNNRFIRTRVQSTWPQLKMIGDPSWNSYGNVFLSFNFLMANGYAAEIYDQKDVTFVGLDAESWNQGNLSQRAMLSTGRMGSLRLMGINGGSVRNCTEFLDTWANEVVLFESQISTQKSPQLILRDTVARALSANTFAYPEQDLAVGAFRFRALRQGVSGTSINGRTTSASTRLKPEAQEALGNVILGGGGEGEAWERPMLPPIPDPAGPAWTVNLSQKPDSTGYLQNLINNQGMAVLPAGTYYISAPLRMNSSQGLIGAGADQTVIIAKKNTFDMIEFTDKTPTIRAARMAVSNLTLQGGRNGIVTSQSGSGTGAQYTDIWLSHVTIRKMASAGILLDRIYAWDNNFVDHVNIVDCGTAFKQMPDPAYTSGEKPGMTYVDKVMFYGCQFAGNALAFDLPAKRADNLISWVNCIFENNTTAAIRMINSNSPIIANCDFVNNGGNFALPTVSTNGKMSIVSCRFDAGERGWALLGAEGSVTVEGSLFESSELSGARILGNCGQACFYNSFSSGLPLGPLNKGLLLNNILAGSDPLLSSPAAEIRDGQFYQLIGGESAPLPLFLFGASFAQAESEFVE